MKKLFLLFAAALFAASCNDTRNFEMIWHTETFTVRAQDWEEYDNSLGQLQYFAYTFDFPELTNLVINEGDMAAFLVDGAGQEPLPVVRPLEDEIAGVSWIRTTDCRFERGRITFFYTNSDFHYNNDEPGTMRFKVVLQVPR